MPVIQGWRADHYRRCMERMSALVDDVALPGVGSTCRRHAGGPEGLIRIVEAIDRELGPSPTRLHLFGAKSGALAELRDHPRVTSADSQAYGSAAQWKAHQRRLTEPGFSKSNAYTAGVMARWYQDQVAALTAPPDARRTPREYPEHAPPFAATWIEGRVRRAWEEMRRPHEEGELDWTSLHAQAAYEWAFMDLDDEPEPGPATWEGPGAPWAVHGLT